MHKSTHPAAREVPTPFRAGRAIDASLLALVAIAAFWPVLSNGFVNWDDPAVLVNNPRLASPGIVAWAFSTTLVGHYQPLAWLVWSAAKSLFGLSPMAFHALSLAGHVANGVLVYCVTHRLAGEAGAPPLHQRTAAVVAASLFLVHPEQVEAVAWASALPYIVSLTALLLAFLAYLDRRLIVSIACYAVSLLVRASAITFPVALALVDLYPLARHRRTSLGRLAVEKIPFAMLAAGAALAESHAREIATFQDVGIGARVTMAVTAPFVYLGRTLLPLRLSPLNPLPISPALDPLPLVFGTAGLVSISVAAWMLRRRWPAFGVGGLAFVVLLAPVAGLTPSGLQATADRYVYLPGVAVALVAGIAVARLLTPDRRGAAGAVLAASVVAALGALTWHQTQHWHDSISLWTRAVDIDPRNDVATYNLASALAEGGRDDEAISRYEQTLRLVPDHDLARQNLAILEAARAEHDGDRLAEAGRLDEASDRYARALALDAKRLHARAARGMLLMRRDRFREAAAELRVAFDGGAADVEIPNALAFALVRIGDSGQAAAVLTRAVATHPDDINLKHNLARLLATTPDSRTRNGELALRLALEVCGRTGNADPRALDTLAAAYAAVGRFDLARDAGLRAAGRARQLGDLETAAEIAAHAQSYRR
jgi:Flp pilus assembly protein TadD